MNNNELSNNNDLDDETIEIFQKIQEFKSYDLHPIGTIGVDSNIDELRHEYHTLQKRLKEQKILEQNKSHCRIYQEFCSKYPDPHEDTKELTMHRSIITKIYNFIQDNPSGNVQENLKNILTLEEHNFYLINKMFDNGCNIV